MAKAKPERRKSQLSADLSAVAPRPTAIAQHVPGLPEAQDNSSTQDSAPKKKLAYYATDEENGRIRAAFMAGRGRYGWRSFSEFQLETILARVEDLETEINGGNPFRGIPPTEGTRGRPIS